MKKIFLILISGLFLFNFANAQEKNNPKFSGLMFGDYFYNINQVDSSKKDLNGFQFRRIYITTDYAVSENFDARFRLEADQGEITSNGKIGVMVKDAYLKWKGIFDGSDLVFGIAPTPAFDVSESAWGYRALEKTIMDYNGIVSSRDLGVDLKGNLINSGNIKYWVKIGNNSGNAPETNKYKRFYGLLQFKPAPGFQFTVYGDYASKPQVVDPLTSEKKSNSQYVGALFLNYQAKDNFSLGAETFYRTIQNNYLPAAASSLQSQNGFGVSLFAWFALAPNLRAVGRFDTVDLNMDKDKDASNLIIAALDYRPAKNVSIMPNVEAKTYQAFDKSDLVGRVTLYYQF